LYGLSLIPGGIVSELVRYYSGTVKVAVVVVDLVDRVSPAVSDGNSFESDASLLKESAIVG